MGSKPWSFFCQLRRVSCMPLSRRSTAHSARPPKQTTNWCNSIYASAHCTGS
jgi:hypothetical protein